MLIIYRTTADGVTWSIDGHRQATCNAAYLAGRKSLLVRTGGDEQGRVFVGGYMLDESQIDELIAAVKDRSRSPIPAVWDAIKAGA